MCAFFLKKADLAKLLLPNPFRSMGTCRETWNSKSLATLQGLAGPEIVETEVAKNERRKEPVVGQCRMRWEVSWVGWPQALHEELSILERQEFKTGCVRCSEDERGHNECDEEAQIP